MRMLSKIQDTPDLESVCFNRRDKNCMGGCFSMFWYTFVIDRNQRKLLHDHCYPIFLWVSGGGYFDRFHHPFELKCACPEIPARQVELKRVYSRYDNTFVHLLIVSIDVSVDLHAIFAFVFNRTGTWCQLVYVPWYVYQTMMWVASPISTTNINIFPVLLIRSGISVFTAALLETHVSSDCMTFMTSACNMH